MHRRTALTILLLGLLAFTGTFGLRAAPGAAVAESTGPELAVYNQGLALVKETRSLPLKEGIQSVTITDVAAQIDPTSVHFKSLTDPSGTSVLEQNFEYDVVSTDKLLNKYLGQSIRLVTQDGTSYEGVLLSANPDVILQDKGGQVVVINRDRVRDVTFPALPEGLITRPSLVWLVDAKKGGDHDSELTYLTNGIGWQANYVLLLANDAAKLDLNGWVTLDNRSGATYQDAKLKLVAGEIARAPQPQVETVLKAAADARMPAPPQVAERGFFEYHLYEVQRPVTVKNNETKQLEFITASDVPAEKFYVYDGSQDLRFYGSPQLDPAYGANTGAKQVRTMLEFSTGKEGVNAQLPKGVVRVYQKDIDGSELLIGESTIDHTPEGEQVRLYIGDAFDIVGERVQTNFKKVGEKVVEESYEITLRNHKKEPVQVRVTEHLYRSNDWEIIQESAKHAKLDSQTIEWRLDVPADGEAKVNYTVRYTF